MDEEIRRQIIAAKKTLRSDSADLKAAFRDVEDAMKAEADIIRGEVAKGRSPIPRSTSRAFATGPFPTTPKT